MKHRRRKNEFVWFDNLQLIELVSFLESLKINSLTNLKFPTEPLKSEKTKEVKAEKAIMKRLGGYIKESAPSKNVKAAWAKEQVSFLVLTLIDRFVFHILAS